MRQDELHPAPGAKHKKKILGRGTGSGHGVTCGKGQKGQKSRSSPTLPRGFEGGQNPLTKRLPQKRGFTNIFKTDYSIVNLDKLAGFAAGSEVTAAALVASGIIKTTARPVKILGGGEIDRALTVKANRVSASARAKIEAAGGKVEEVENAAEAE